VFGESVATKMPREVLGAQPKSECWKGKNLTFNGIPGRAKRLENPISVGGEEQGSCCAFICSYTGVGWRNLTREVRRSKSEEILRRDWWVLEQENKSRFETKGGFGGRETNVQGRELEAQMGLNKENGFGVGWQAASGTTSKRGGG